MSLLSSHRLHWGSHHELTDHFWVIVDHLIHPPAHATAEPQAQAAAKGSPLAGAPSSLDTASANARLDALGP